MVAFNDYKALSTEKGMSQVKAAGKYRIEGKTYVGASRSLRICRDCCRDEVSAPLGKLTSSLVKDGDIIHFQFNVTNSKK